MSMNKKQWATPHITAVEQLSAAQVAGHPMGLPKTSAVDSEGIYQGGNS